MRARIQDTCSGRQAHIPDIQDVGRYSRRLQDFRNIRRKAPFSEKDELPAISIQFRKIMGNLPMRGDSIFRTLIAAGVPDFRALFTPCLADLFRPDIWPVAILD